MAVGVESLARTSQTSDPTFSSRPRRLFCFKNYFYFYVLYFLPARNRLCLLVEKKVHYTIMYWFHSLRYSQWLSYFLFVVGYISANLDSYVLLQGSLLAFSDRTWLRSLFWMLLCRISLVSCPVAVFNIPVTAVLFWVKNTTIRVVPLWASAGSKDFCHLELGNLEYWGSTYTGLIDKGMLTIDQLLLKS